MSDYDVTQIASKAWATSPEGESLLEGKRVVKKGKLLLISTPLGEIVPGNYYHVVAFPKPAHVEHFVKAAHGVRGGGPAQENPGAVGSLALFVQNGRIELSYAQAHYKTQDTDFPLSRSLATQYAGWRVHALEEAITHAHSTGMPLVISKRENQVRRLLKNKGTLLNRIAKAVARTPTPFKRELRKACANANGVWTENRREIVISPPRPTAARSLR